MRDDDDAFSLWAIPGPKSIVHDGKRLLVKSRLGRRLVRLAVSLTLSDGAPYAFAVPPGRDRRAQDARQATEQLIDVLHGVKLPRRGAALTRGQIVHMRALQALDAERAGLSERDIGEAVLGAVPGGDKWNDSAERAQIRYLLRHGRRYRDGGYRRLLRASGDQPSPETGRKEVDSTR